MKLSEAQIRDLIWIFYMSCIGCTKASRMNQRTLQALIKRKLVRYHPADYQRVTLTAAGNKLVLTHYHHHVINMSVNVFGLSYPPIVVEETLRRMPSANLPVYLTHKNLRIRELARRAIEDTDGTN